MKFEEISKLVCLMSEHNLTEVKIEADGCNLSIRRGGEAVAVPVIQQAVAAPVAAAAAPAAAPAAAAPAEAAAPKATIDSPLVGTFYRAPSPEAAPFIQLGDRVTADSTVCIIEAMKVMNEVKAEKSGVIKEILIENGQPVEYGQPMFVIE